MPGCPTPFSPKWDSLLLFSLGGGSLSSHIPVASQMGFSPLKKARRDCLSPQRRLVQTLSGRSATGYPSAPFSFWKLRSFGWTVSCLSMRVGIRQAPITSGSFMSPSSFKEPVVPYRHRVG